MLEQQTWVTLLGFAGFGLALMGYLANMKRDLKTDIADARAEFRTDIADARAEFRTDIADARAEFKAGISDLKVDLKADIGRIESRLITLDDRTYDISTRLPPASASTSPHSH